MADMNQLYAGLSNPSGMKGLFPQPGAGVEEPGEEVPEASPYSDEELLELWEEVRKECLEGREIFEKQWHRNILYVLGRQWIEHYPRAGGWKDKRMAQWIPRPVTNKCKDTVIAIRAMFCSIKLGVNVRPNGSKPENVSAASVADELAPVLHEDHQMDANMSEFDFWLIVTGNAFLHTFVDYDLKYGTIQAATECCTTCGMETASADLAGATPCCPECGGSQFMPAMDPATGQPKMNKVPKGKPVTITLSPLEMAFPNSYPRFSEVPMVVRLRWRPRGYVKNSPLLSKYDSKIAWQKSPSDQSMSLFRALANHNDLGVAPAYSDSSATANGQDEGVPEYEVWVKPCEDYPEGLVFRVMGDKTPIVIHLEDTEAIPGPLPYKAADGTPLFPFTHSGYEPVGGRIWASGPIDLIVQKQDMLNQLDSMILLIVQRMSNPVWIKPKGAGVTAVTGMPGLVIEWDSLTVGGNAKPERIPGEGPNPALFQIREQYLRDIEELAGTFDIVKGAQPSGVEAFSALQLLVERSQARFATVFSARGSSYRDWYRTALELERQFGPEERSKAILTPARQWTFQNFKKTQLQGSVTVVVEDGSNAPKTSLGMRAALEHASQLKMLDMSDPDQRYEGLKLFGLTRLAPTLDIHVQSALQKQQAFEQWAQDPAAMQQALAQSQTEVMQWQDAASQPGGSDSVTGEPLTPVPSILAHTPLIWYDWYNPDIHRQEFLKWANGDRIRQLLQTNPGVQSLLTAHLNEIEQAMVKQAQLMAQRQAAAMPAPPPVPQTGSAMGNSNRESTSGNEPRGNGQGAQRQGPA